MPVDLEYITKEIYTDARYEYIQESIKSVEQALALYSSKDELWMAFNAGKDCLVLYYLTKIAIFRKLSQKASEKEILKEMHKINYVYFEEPDSFEEVEEFFEKVCEQEEIKALKRSRDIKKELADIQSKYPIRAILLGTRKNDPYCENLSAFSPTDTEKGWAPLMRVNPIIDWSLTQVWEFIKNFEIPYCQLYDEGYTHLGNKDNTVKNKYLLKDDGAFYPSSECENVFENYSRKYYTARDDYLSTEVLVGFYDQDVPQEITKIMAKAIPLLSKKNENVQLFGSNSEKFERLLKEEIDKNITVIAHSKHRAAINEIINKFSTSKIKTMWL